MKTIRVLTAGMIALALAGTSAWGQGAPKAKTACAADMQKLCPSAADPHAAHKCLRSHMADVSPDCHSAMVAAKAAHDARKADEATSVAPPAAGPPPASPPPAAPH